jgi:glycerol-1-phosphate dehydrogenase [NAD(P)+]
MGRPDKIGQLLAGSYIDPDSKKPVRVETKSLIILPTLKGAEYQAVKDLGFGRRVAVVSDVTTHEILAQRVEGSLAPLYDVTSIVLPRNPYPDGETVEKIRLATARCDAVIAVGSGTINDVCKYGSALDKKPYAVFATAPSMNGYTSLNAAITVHGHKMSLPAQAPVGAFFDLGVLAAAPARMIRSGLGDSLCRTTAQADWLLSHLLFGHAYRQLPYELLADDEGPLFAQAADLMKGDLKTMELLVRTLVLSGFGTAIIGTSQPASQGEHLISHYIDMFCDKKRPTVFHGEQVGVTTLSMARLQHAVLGSTPVVTPDTATEADFKKRYGDELGASCWTEFKAKFISKDKAAQLNDILKKQWDAIREKISKILLPAAHLADVLKASGADLAPEQIALPRLFYESALLNCRDIRGRYTFLDLAASSGQLRALTKTI